MFDQTFSKDNRLLKKNDFLNLQKGSSCLKNDSFIVYYKKRINESTETRIGISCSKKVGKAFLRNRLKRLIREYFRKSSFKNNGIDVLFVVKKQNKTNDTPIIHQYEEGLLKNLENIFNKIGKGERSIGKNSIKVY